MTRDELARVLTDLDDELIAEAQDAGGRSGRPAYWPLLAASLLLGLLFLWNSWNQPALTVSFQGQALTAAALDLGDLAGIPTPAGPAPRTGSRITLPLRLDLKGSHKMEALDGLMTIQDSQGSLLLAEGQTFEGSGLLDLTWHVDPASAKEFILELQGPKETRRISLRLDASGQWALQLEP